MAQYEWTKHARQVQARRAIPLECIERVLYSPMAREPDRVDGSLEHRLGRIPEHGNRVLRVVVNVRANPPKIITVYWDRGMRTKL